MITKYEQRGCTNVSKPSHPDKALSCSQRSLLLLLPVIYLFSSLVLPHLGLMPFVVFLMGNDRKQPLICVLFLNDKFIDLLAFSQFNIT